MKSKTGRRQSLTLTNLQTDRSKTQGKKQPMCFQDTCLFCPLIKVKVKFPQSCLTFCDPMDCRVFGIFRARILEWVAVPFSRGLSQPRDRTQVSSTSVDSLPVKPQGKPKNTGVGSLSLLQGIFPSQESNRVSCIAGRLFTN